jgi:hypothetical protein
MNTVSDTLAKKVRENLAKSELKGTVDLYCSYYKDTFQFKDLGSDTKPLNVPKRFHSVKGTFQWVLFVLQTLPSKELYMSNYIKDRLREMNPNKGICRFCVKGAVSVASYNGNGAVHYGEIGLSIGVLDFLESKGFEFLTSYLKENEIYLEESSSACRKNTWRKLVRYITKALEDGSWKTDYINSGYYMGEYD